MDNAKPNNARAHREAAYKQRHGRFLKLAIELSRAHGRGSIALAELNAIYRAQCSRDVIAGSANPEVSMRGPAARVWHR